MEVFTRQRSRSICASSTCPPSFRCPFECWFPFTLLTLRVLPRRWNAISKRFRCPDVLSPTIPMCISKRTCHEEHVKDNPERKKLFSLKAFMKTKQEMCIRCMSSCETKKKWFAFGKKKKTYVRFRTNESFPFSRLEKPSFFLCVFQRNVRHRGFVSCFPFQCNARNAYAFGLDLTKEISTMRSRRWIKHPFFILLFRSAKRMIVT